MSMSVMVTEWQSGNAVCNELENNEKNEVVI